MRSRNLKPGFFKNEELATLHPLTRILFQGLWCMADRAGRLEFRPKRIKAEILPYDDHNVTQSLVDLCSSGFLILYPVGSRGYIEIINFQKHQNPHTRESETYLPGPELASDNFSSWFAEHCSSTVLGNAKNDIVKVLGILDDNIEGISKGESGIRNQMGEASAQEPETILNKIPYEEIVSYLNEQTGKQFKHSSQETRRLIHARWNQGFTLEDFKTVIRRKSERWKSNPEMMDYLRPITLFGTKFEGYLNECSRTNGSGSYEIEEVTRTMDDGTVITYENGKEVRYTIVPTEDIDPPDSGQPR